MKYMPLLAALTLASACSAERPLRLTYIANEGVVVASGSRRVVIDALFDAPNPAYLAPSPALLQDLMGGDLGDDSALVLVTHNHPDHFRAAVADRFLLAHPQSVMIAPADVVDVMRDSAEHWSAYADRVRPISLGVGEGARQTYAGVQVHAIRTLHSGGSEHPMNLLYLVRIGGRTLLHEGDSDSDPNVFRAVAAGGDTIQLALVPYWYPFTDAGRYILSVLKPSYVGLMHLPVHEERFTPEVLAGLGDRVRLLSRPGEEWVVR